MKIHANIVRSARFLARSCGLGLLAGAAAGGGAWIFLELLDGVISFRQDTAPWLIWLLPAGAFLIVAAVHHLGARSREGTRLVVGAARGTDAGPIPGRMAPFALFGTLGAHLFGASVGREGTAVQMSGSLAETLGRPLNLDDESRRDLLVASIAGGFGAVFGVPFAGVMFAIEVAWRNRRMADAPRVLGSSIVAAFSGYLLVDALGHHHAERPSFHLDLTAVVVVRLFVAGLAFGLTAWLFRTGVWATKRILSRFGYPPLRAAIAGGLVVLATVVIGRTSLSLSLPVADAAIEGDLLSSTAWFSKLALTVLSLGGGLPGGEVTPLFVTGAALGAALAQPLSLAQGSLASIGFVSVFGAAARAPVTAVVLAAELFGPQAILPASVAATAGLISRGRGGVYEPEGRSETTPGRV